MTQNGFAERYFHAQDGLRLYFRDYGDRHSARTPLLCLSGLTRNSQDFHEFACRHAGTRRVIAMDYRGRGRSDYDPDPLHYDPTTYIGDILHLLVVAHVHRVVILGTSLGGILAMAMTAAMPTALAGVILNDIGPQVSDVGRQRIAGYVGTEARVRDYETGADLWRQGYAGTYPKLNQAGWMRISRASFVPDQERGDLRQNYDLRIADGLRAQAKQPLPDLWPLFRGLRNVPVLSLRGAKSDILAVDTFIQMKREHAGMIAVTVPDVGHTPMLDEPEAEAAIDAFLADL